jgi:hypothetical protein
VAAVVRAKSRSLVNDRITEQQAKVFAEVKDIPQTDLDELPVLEVAASD